MVKPEVVAIVNPTQRAHDKHVYSAYKGTRIRWCYDDLYVFTHFQRVTELAGLRFLVFTKKQGDLYVAYDVVDII